MRTAIFVYRTTSLTICTHESDLELSHMNANPVLLSAGDNTRTLDPGVYKIVSNLEVKITGDDEAFESIVTTEDKDNDPRLLPSRATTIFAPLDESATRAFLAVPEAKTVISP